MPGSWTQFFPAQGNLLAAVNIYPGSTISAITDSNGNTWTQAHTDVGTPAIQYAQNPTTSSTLTVTVPLTNANANTTITLYDITGPRLRRSSRRPSRSRTPMRITHR